MPRRQSILVLDNYDSFTFNLVHYLAELGASVDVVRADAITPQHALASDADAFLISPGPGKPKDAGSSIALVEACASACRPLLGVCLGHQAIACCFGGRIVHAPTAMHGKTDKITHDGAAIFKDLPSPFEATRYHSLVVDEVQLSAELTITARSSDGVIQGLKHRTLPIHGVQFHPESAATEFGRDLIRNFLEIAAT